MCPKCGERPRQVSPSADAFWKILPRPPIQSGHVEFTKYRIDVAL